MFKLSAGAALVLCASFLAASPSGHQVVHGHADVQALQNLMKITTSDKAIINWNEFSCGAGEMIQFIQPSSSSAVLNRVIGGNTSLLYGDLQANGQVYLVNPNGIVTGLHARIDAGALIASTLDVLDQDFIQGSALRFFGDSKAGVINLGTIKTSSGDAILFGYQVENDGTIDAAGKASLVASNKVVLKLDDFQRVFIASDAALFPGDTIDDPCLLAFNQAIAKDALHFKKDETGVFLSIDAPVATVAGSIRADSVSILGNYVQVLDGALIDASRKDGGGEILIGGDYQGKNESLLNARQTHVAKDASLRSDALEQGDGGKIILWSDEWTGFYGQISARGGSGGGDGGFVEVSGRSLDFHGLVDRQAPLGQAGMLLLDPININITGAVGNSVNVIPPPPVVGTYTFSACAPTPAIISNTLLNGNLALGSVTISTSATGGVGCGDAGDITVVAPVTWATAGNTLTLIADRDVIFNTNIDITSTAAGCDISVQAGRHVQMNGRVQNTAAAPGANVSVIANTGDINVPNIAGLSTPVCIGTDFGTVLARATLGSITLVGGTGAVNSYASIGSTTSAAVTRSATITAEAGGNITLTGGIGNSKATIGQTSNPANNVMTTTTNINVTARGNISCNSGFFGAGIGLNFGEPTLIDVTGDIRVNAGGNVTISSSSATVAIGIAGTGGACSVKSNLYLNVGGNLLLQGLLVGGSTGVNLGFNQNEATAPVLSTSANIFVAGNIWLDARILAVCRLTGSYKTPNPLYRQESLIHCLGNIILLGGTGGGGNEAIFDYSRGVNSSITNYTAHVWAAGSPQNVFDPNGGIRCVNGDVSGGMGGGFASVLGNGNFLPNTSVRSTGDIIIGSSAGFSVAGAGSSAPYSAFNPQFNGLFIEADTCFAVGELWPAQSATVAGANIFAGTLLGSASPAFACDGLGAFAYDDNEYSTTTAGLPTPYNGAQLVIPFLPLVATPLILDGIDGTANNIVIHSADTFLGELFRPVVPGVGIPNTSFSPGAPASISFMSTGANNIQIQRPFSNIEISGSGPVPAIGPALTTPAHLCSCINSFNTITIGTVAILPTSGFIYMSANNNIIQTNAVGSSLSATGAPATSFITLISDLNNSGAGSITLANNITTAGGPIMLSAGIGAGVGTSGITQTAGQVSSGIGTITAQAAGNILIASTTAPAFVSTSGNQLILSNSGDITISQGVNATTGSVTVTANLGNIIVNALGEVQTTTGAITLTAGNDIDLNGLATTLLSTSGPIFSTAGNNTNVTQNVATSGPITMISGVNMFLLSPTTNISSSASPVILVVDNDFPSPPGIGPGFFSMAAGSQVNSGPGQPLQVFTAQQNLNIMIPGFLNGFTFAPGTIFIDTDTEHWCVYYPDPFFGGPGYTIFYKNCLSVIAPAANEVVSEMLFSFNPANEWTDEIYILPQVWRFMLIYPPGVNALTDYASEPYWISRKKIHLLHDPQVYKQDKPLSELVE